MTNLGPQPPMDPRRALPSQLLPLDPRLGLPLDESTLRRSKPKHEQPKHQIMVHEQPKFQQDPAVRLDYLIQVKVLNMFFILFRFYL